MQVSLQSTVYLGTCVAINAYAAYSNPVRWVTTFVLGVLVGTERGRYYLHAARDGDQPRNNVGMGSNPFTDLEVKMKAVKSLANSMPGLVSTALNSLALGLINRRVPLPSGWNPVIGVAICDAAVIRFGYSVGKLFQLDILQKDKDLTIQRVLAQTII